MVLERTNSVIDYSDSGSALVYGDSFVGDVVSEIGKAINNQFLVELRFETKHMTYDHIMKTKLLSVKHVDKMLCIQIPESEIRVEDVKIEEGNWTSNSFKFYIKNDEITITVIIFERKY